mmetsp:Transcript_18547/g.51580  ORF Transcript_18547/g.51580 Transcript_18547/m.51580 type:complete len:105 (-) Transcript_18547:1090-1404(-)
MCLLYYFVSSVLRIVVRTGYLDRTLHESAPSRKCINGIPDGTRVNERPINLLTTHPKMFGRRVSRIKPFCWCNGAILHLAMQYESFENTSRIASNVHSDMIVEH